MGDIPPWLGDKLWPASRFLGSGRIFFSLHYYVSWTDVIHQFLPLVPAIKIATNRYRPARHEAEAFHSDPEIRGRFLPSFIHNHPNPALSKSSRALARFRETAFMQKTLNICQTFIGSFFGVALVCVMARSQPFLTRRAPVIVGSFGAEAVLVYASHTSPLVQPRNILIGNCLSAVIGVALAKGFTQLSDFRIDDNGNVNWAAASLSIACAIAAMQIFNVTHPPGGATAVLAVTVTMVYNLDWLYVAQMAGGSGIMLAWGLIVNNLGKRTYPTFWISPVLAKKVKENSGRKLP